MGAKNRSKGDEEGKKKDIQRRGMELVSPVVQSMM